jgi:hypothetical protein
MRLVTLYKNKLCRLCGETITAGSEAFSFFNSYVPKEGLKPFHFKVLGGQISYSHTTCQFRTKERKVDYKAWMEERRTEGLNHKRHLKEKTLREKAKQRITLLDQHNLNFWFINPKKSGKDKS